MSGPLDEKLFLLIIHRLRTDEQFAGYARDGFFLKADSDELQKVIDEYPSGGVCALLAISRNIEMCGTRCHPGIFL